jgi:Methyltransferase domain
MSDRAEFRVARFEETGLADDAADAIMSIDALIFSENKPAAFRELHRIPTLATSSPRGITAARCRGLRRCRRSSALLEETDDVRVPNVIFLGYRDALPADHELNSTPVMTS